MAEPAQVVGGRQTTRPGADHEHPLAAADRGRVELPSLLQRQVAEEPLDRMDRDGAVEIGAVADALARVVADPPVDRGQRIVGDELTPRLLVPARLGVREPGLDVLAGRAAGIARRQQIDVDGSALADRAGVGPSVQQVRQRRDVPHRVAHASPSSRTTIAPRLTPLAVTGRAHSRQKRSSRFLARGGIPVAAQVAGRLDLPLDAVAVRKVGHPWQPEYAPGAAAPGREGIPQAGTQVLAMLKARGSRVTV